MKHRPAIARDPLVAESLARSFFVPAMAEWSAALVFVSLVRITSVASCSACMSPLASHDHKRAHREAHCASHRPGRTPPIPHLLFLRITPLPRLFTQPPSCCSPLVPANWFTCSSTIRSIRRPRVCPRRAPYATALPASPQTVRTHSKCAALRQAHGEALSQL